jgi:putative transposase
MKKSRFTETQIVEALNRHENGQSVADIARNLGVTAATFYTWRKKYAGVDASQLKRLKELEAENAKLKKMYAEQAIHIEALKDVVSKKW